MKVIDGRTKKTVPFGDLPLGTVYADEKNNVCIKTDEAEYEVNCITLRDGTWYAETESATEIVTILNAQLTIEN